MSTLIMRLVPLVALGVVGLGCSGDETSTSPTTAASTATSVFQPAGAAQTPFCEAMSAISSRVNTDPPDDLNAYLLHEYEQLLPVVPDAISSEFRSVIDGLRGAPVDTCPSTIASGSTGTTIELGTFADGGFQPDPEPVLRLNSYLAANCFGTQSNPGPPATAPLDQGPDTTTG